MVRILRETDALPVSEVAKQHGVSDQTLYSWSSASVAWRRRM